MLTSSLAVLVLLITSQPPSPESVEKARVLEINQPSPQHRDHAALQIALARESLDNATVWRGYKQQEFPSKGWDMLQGTLTSAVGGGGGDLLTREHYADFDFEFSFKCSPKANSGVIYRVTEKHSASWQTGPEFQVLDDTGHNLKPDNPHSAGAMYELVNPAADKVYKTGEWNTGRVYHRNGLVKHFLNGKKVAEITAFNDNGTPTDAWTKAIAASKFKAYDGFGLQPRGHLVLQDHGDKVQYTGMTVRDLSASPQGEQPLFNGKDLTGWTAFVPELAGKGLDQSAPWTVENGVLRCAGMPGGYIRTDEKYTNFVLRLQWRFDPAKGAGNSGVLLRTNGEDKVWPRSIEAQLHSGNAGDFWNIGTMKMTADPERTKGRNTKKTHNAERPLGQWNEYEIICQRGNVMLYVNGELLNHGTDAEETPGHICLQSEGAYIEFRNIRIFPLP